MCKYSTKGLRVQLLTMFMSLLFCHQALSCLSAHPRNLTSLCLLLDDSLLQGGGSHKACQAANTFGLLVGPQEGPAASPGLLKLPLKGKSAF